MAEKKRKRQEQREERPAKKVAIAPPNTTVRVKYVEEKDAPLAPVIAATPGLTFPSNIPLKPYKTETRILPPGVPQPPYKLLLHSSDHPKLDYLAQEEKDGSAETLLKNYVGVFDPATNELQLMEVRKLTLRSTLRSEMEELREEREQAAQVATMSARRAALGMEFGSKKSRKAILERTENAISRGPANDSSAAPNPATDAVASAVLSNMSKTTAAMPTRKELDESINENKPRPKANLAAESPRDVYPINTIVGKDLMAGISVKDWVDAATAGEAVEVASRYVARRMNKFAKNGEGDSSAIKKLKVLRFILLCINFLASLKGMGKGAKRLPPRAKLVELLNCEGPVADSLKRRFASENGDMTRWHVDNLMTHICAAALIVDDFEVDVNDLRDDLKLENKDIKRYFLELGCKYNPPTETERTKMKITKAETINHSLAKLKIPLVFPRAARAGAKRR